MPRAPSFPLPLLARPFSGAARRALARALEELLHWQRELRGWPEALPSPEGTPIVSLYLDGALKGCTGVGEGPPRERLARAFLQALADPRFGGIARPDRARLTAQVAYPTRPRPVALDRVEAALAPGVHGLALSEPNAPPTVLLPDVARDYELDATGLLEALEHKRELARAQWGSRRLYSFETESIVVRPGAPDRSRRRVDPSGAALRWLVSQVASDGAVAFGVEPRSGERQSDGVMSHGRAAVVVQALGMHAAGRAAASWARVWLARELTRGLAGRLPSFPRELPLVAGTLALARLAGVACAAPLAEIATSRELEVVPWHAAQVVCALGAAAPARLYRACVSALDEEPRAPWTALAARALGDSVTYARVAHVLAAWVPRGGPHEGGVRVGTLPEVALTALVAEALAGSKERSARAARQRALRFLRAQQHLERVPADVVDPALAFGAFPLTPVHAYLRSDVTAHAVIALEAAEDA